MTAYHATQLARLERRAAAVGYRLSAASGRPHDWPYDVPHIEFVISLDGKTLHEVLADETVDVHFADIAGILTEIEQGRRT